MSMFTLGEPIRNHRDEPNGNVTVDLPDGANVPTLITNVYDPVIGRFRNVELVLDREAVYALMAQFGQAAKHM